VRVVVGLVQDENYHLPAAGSCQAWVDQYELTSSVLLDPLQKTQTYFAGGCCARPDRQLPGRDGAPRVWREHEPRRPIKIAISAWTWPATPRGAEAYEIRFMPCKQRSVGSQRIIDLVQQPNAEGRVKAEGPAAFAFKDAHPDRGYATARFDGMLGHERGARRDSRTAAGDSD